MQLVHAWVRLALFIHSLIVVAQMNTALAEWVCEAALLQQYTLGTCWNLYLMLFGLFFLFPETALKSTTSGFSTGTAKVVLQHKGPQSPIEQAAKAWVSGCQYTSVSHQSQYINLDRAIVFINYTFPDALHIIYCSSFCLYDNEHLSIS